MLIFFSFLSHKINAHIFLLLFHIYMDMTYEEGEMDPPVKY